MSRDLDTLRSLVAALYVMCAVATIVICVLVDALRVTRRTLRQAREDAERYERFWRAGVRCLTLGDIVDGAITADKIEVGALGDMPNIPVEMRNACAFPDCDCRLPGCCQLVGRA